MDDFQISPQQNKGENRVASVKKDFERVGPANIKGENSIPWRKTQVDNQKTSNKPCVESYMFKDTDSFTLFPKKDYTVVISFGLTMLRTRYINRIFETTSRPSLLQADLV